MNASIQPRPLGIPKNLQVLMFGTAVLATAALIYRYIPDRDARAASDSFQVASQADPDLVDKTDDYRALALQRFNEGNFFAPAGDNALEYYLRASAEDPSDSSRAEAVLELVPMTMDALQVAIQANDAVEVTRLFALLTQADPASARLIALKARWEASQQGLAQSTPVPESGRATETLPLPTAQLAAEENTNMTSDSSEAATDLQSEEPKLIAQREPSRSVAAPPVSAQAEVASLNLPSPADASAAEPSATGLNTARIVEARALTTAPPAFPDDARRRRIEGWVDLELSIDDAGRVVEASVIASEPSKIFESAARRAVLRWRFSPKLVDSVPTSSTVRRRISFDLNS